jgi:DNA-binding HxlR family transcriptional regulator
MNKLEDGIFFNGEKYICTLEFAMDIIGGKWKNILIFHLQHGPKRSGELQREITGITNKMFTQTVRDLERQGIIHRKVYSVIPPKVEYSLTPRGESVVPIINQIALWGKNVAQQMLEEKQK